MKFQQKFHVKFPFAIPPATWIVIVVFGFVVAESVSSRTWLFALVMRPAVVVPPLVLFLLLGLSPCLCCPSPVLSD